MVERFVVGSSAKLVLNGMSEVGSVMQMFDVAMAVAAGVTLGLVLAQVESDAQHASGRAWRFMVGASGILTLAYAGMNDHWIFAGCVILGYAIEFLRKAIWPVDPEDGQSEDGTQVAAVQSEA